VAAGRGFPPLDRECSDALERGQLVTVPAGIPREWTGQTLFEKGALLGRLRGSNIRRDGRRSVGVLVAESCADARAIERRLNRVADWSDERLQANLMGYQFSIYFDEVVPYSRSRGESFGPVGHEVELFIRPLNSRESDWRLFEKALNNLEKHDPCPLSIFRLHRYRSRSHRAAPAAYVRYDTHSAALSVIRGRLDILQDVRVEWSEGERCSSKESCYTNHHGTVLRTLVCKFVNQAAESLPNLQFIGRPADRVCSWCRARFPGDDAAPPCARVQQPTSEKDIFRPMFILRLSSPSKLEDAMRPLNLAMQQVYDFIRRGQQQQTSSNSRFKAVDEGRCVLMTNIPRSWSSVFLQSELQTALGKATGGAWCIERADVLAANRMVNLQGTQESPDRLRALVNFGTFEEAEKCVSLISGAASVKPLLIGGQKIFAKLNLFGVKCELCKRPGHIARMCRVGNCRSAYAPAATADFSGTGATANGSQRAAAPEVETDTEGGDDDDEAETVESSGPATKGVKRTLSARSRDSDLSI